jgi:hypothetical protein
MRIVKNRKGYMGIKVKVLRQFEAQVTKAASQHPFEGQVWCRKGYNSVKPFQSNRRRPQKPTATPQDTLCGDIKTKLIPSMAEDLWNDMGGDEAAYYSGQSHRGLNLDTNPKFRGWSDFTERFDNVLIEEFEKLGLFQPKDVIYDRIVRIERNGEVIYDSDSGK